MAESPAPDGSPPVTRGAAPRLREHLPLLIILVVGAAVYVAASWYQWVDLDEGLYLGAAVSVAHGSIPFVDFASREPVLIYWLALGVSLLGPSLFVGRVMVDILGLVAAVGIYAVTGRVASRWAALAAVVLFLFNPFDIYYGSIIAVEAALAAPLVWSVYFLYRTSKPSVLDALASGLLLGVAVLTLRDSIALAPLFLVLLAWVFRADARAVLVRFGGWILGVFLTLGTVVLTFVALTSFSWIWTELGPGPSYFNHVQPLLQRLGTLGYTSVFEPALLVLICLAPGAALIASGRRWWGERLGEAAGLLIIAGPWLAVTYFSHGAGDLLFPAVILLGALLLFSWFGGLRALVGSYAEDEQPPGQASLLAVCAVWILIDIVVDAIVSANYFVHRILEFSVPGSMVGGILLVRFLTAYPSGSGVSSVSGSHPTPAAEPRFLSRLGGGRSVLASGVVVLLVVSSLFSAVAVLGPSNPYNEPYVSGLSSLNADQRAYSLQEVNAVAGYLDANSRAGATLFSGDLAFLTAANRPELLNLSIMIDLYNRPLKFDSLPLGPSFRDLAPSWSRIFQHWNATYVPLVVVGARTVDLETNFPYLESYIASHYTLVATFGDLGTPSGVEVWKVGTAEAGGIRTASSTGPGDSTSSLAYLPSTNTVALASWDGHAIDFLNASTFDLCGNYSLPSSVTGVRFLSVDPSTGSLWAGTLGQNLFVAQVGSACRATSAFEVNLTGSPTAIAFDPTLNAAVIGEESEDLVAVVNDTSGNLIRSFTVVSSPVAISALPGTDQVYVTSGSSDDVGSYDVSTGAETSLTDVGFEANNILVTSSTLLLTWSAPGLVDWLNRTTGVVTGSAAVGPEAEGWATEGGLVAVGSYGSGVVTLLNLTGVAVVGSLSTRTCPAAVTFVASAGSLAFGGACNGSAELWLVKPLVQLSLGPVGAGNTLRLNGLLVETPSVVSLLPGYYWLNASGPGRVSQSTRLAVTNDTSWTPVLGASFAGVRQLQGVFVGLVVLGAVAATVLCFRFRPPPRRPPG